jgi:hypothetical protein
MHQHQHSLSENLQQQFHFRNAAFYSFAASQRSRSVLSFLQSFAFVIHLQGVIASSHGSRLWTARHWAWRDDTLTDGYQKFLLHLTLWHCSGAGDGKCLRRIDLVV